MAAAMVVVEVAAAVGTAVVAPMTAALMTAAADHPQDLPPSPHIHSTTIFYSPIPLLCPIPTVFILLKIFVINYINIIVLYYFN